MRVLLIGGTGLISTGIVKHLLARGADVTMFNRGRRENTLPPNIKIISGDRDRFDEFERNFRDGDGAGGSRRYDVVIDMIAFTPEQGESSIRAFGGRCAQFIFCSTVCTYGVKVPPRILVDETFPQEPISTYGRNKVTIERLMQRAHEQGKFQATTIRPSYTYGPGNALIDNLEFDPVAWDRVEKGLPVLCAGDGLGLWVATHRDDVGKLFAHACLNPKTYGQAYNATRDEQFTWRDYYRQAAAALGRQANVLFVPAAWIVRHDPRRFGLLHEISGYHGAYCSEKAKRDVPEFRCEYGFEEGARQTFADARRRKAWKSQDGDTLYQSIVDKALAAGAEPVVA